MKTKEELDMLKAKVDTLNKKLAALDEDELAQVTGGMSEIDEAVLNGTVFGHLFNAGQSAQKTGNTKLITAATELMTKCKNREYLQIVNTINELLPRGLYDSSDNDAYESLKKAKETIERSGILKA